jgi:hypothetical protein
MSEIAPPSSRAFTIEEVHRLIGALTLELDQVRRENLALRAQLEHLAANGASPR